MPGQQRLGRPPTTPDKPQACPTTFFAKSVVGIQPRFSWVVLKNTGGWVGEREVKLQALILDVGAAEVLDDDLPAHFLKPRLDGLGLLADWGVPRGLRRAARERLCRSHRTRLICHRSDQQLELRPVRPHEAGRGVAIHGNGGAPKSASLLRGSAHKGRARFT